MQTDTRTVFGIAGRCAAHGGDFALLFADHRPGERLEEVPARRWMSAGRPQPGDEVREGKWGWSRVRQSTSSGES